MTPASTPSDSAASATNSSDAAAVAVERRARADVASIHVSAAPISRTGCQRVDRIAERQIRERPRRRARRGSGASRPSALSWCATSPTSRARSPRSTSVFTSPFACGRSSARRNSGQRSDLRGEARGERRRLLHHRVARDGVGQRAVAHAIADRGQRVRGGADQRLVERRLAFFRSSSRSAPRRGTARCRRRSSPRARRSGRAHGTRRACSSLRGRSASAAPPWWPSRVAQADQLAELHVRAGRRQRARARRRRRDAVLIGARARREIDVPLARHRQPLQRRALAFRHRDDRARERGRRQRPVDEQHRVDRARRRPEPSRCRPRSRARSPARPRSRRVAFDAGGDHRRHRRRRRRSSRDDGGVVHVRRRAHHRGCVRRQRRFAQHARS